MVPFGGQGTIHITAQPSKNTVGNSAHLVGTSTFSTFFKDDFDVACFICPFLSNIAGVYGESS